MRLSRIWSLPDMTMLQRFRLTEDWAARVAAIRLPNRVKYWAVMVAIGQISNTGTFAARGPTGLTVDEIVRGLEADSK